MSPQRKYLLLALLALLGTICAVAHASPTSNATSRSLHSGSVSKRRLRSGHPMNPVIMRRGTTIADRLEKIDALMKTATSKKIFQSVEEKAAKQEAMEELKREILLAKSAIKNDDNSEEAEKVREHYAWLKKKMDLN